MGRVSRAQAELNRQHIVETASRLFYEDGIAAVGLPAYSAGTHAATNVTLHHPVDVQRPVACGGVSVFPGDALVGDDGVAVGFR